MKNKIINLVFIFFLIILIIVGILLYNISDNILISKLNSLSTLLLSIFTLIYVFLTYLILRSNNKMVIEQNRPFVIFNLPTEGTNLILSIKNIGKRPAYNVKISTNNKLEKLVTLKGFSFSDAVLPFLSQKFIPPDYEIKNIIGKTMNILELNEEDKKIEVNINYFDSDNNEYNKSYEIDLNNAISKQKIVQDHRPVYYFKKISENLNEMRKSIEQLKHQEKETLQ